MVAPETTSGGEAIALAERVLEIFVEPLPLRQGDLFVSASIGVATAVGDHGLTADDLLRHADTAMYRAKDAGRNCIAVFDESMLEKVSQRLSVETALYRALDRRELKLFHQPIIDVIDGTVSGFEALMRWDRSDGVLVSPAEFIPIAEETGIIVPIGAWALLDALSTLAEWCENGTCGPKATMSVERVAAPARRPELRRHRARGTAAQRRRARAAVARGHRERDDQPARTSTRHARADPWPRRADRDRRLRYRLLLALAAAEVPHPADQDRPLVRVGSGRGPERPPHSCEP